MKLLNKKVLYRNLGLFIVAIGVATSLHVTQASAYDVTYINSQLPGGVGTAIAWDSGCWNTMHNNYFGAQSPYRNKARASINAGGSYADTTWVSARSQGATTTIGVDYGTKSVDLQLNGLTFLCSALVAPDGAGVDYLYSDGRVVHDYDAPNDRSPNPMGGNINWPARTDQQFRVDSASSSDGGAISFPTNLLGYGRNPWTRYWFGALPFTYTSPSPAGITSDQNITITVWGIPIVQYYGDREFCNIGGDKKTFFDFNNCPQSNTSFTISLKLNYKYNLIPSVSVDGQLKDSAVQAGMSAVVSPNVHNDGPTPSPSTAWQLSRFIVKTGGSYPAGVHESNSDPATYYGNNLARLDGASAAFAVGNNSLNKSAQTIPDEPVGSRVCYTLSVQPYSQDSGQWRHGDPYCLLIGKSPKVQVQGGDLSVGKLFSGSSSLLGTSDITTSNSVKDGHTFGSWVEYGIFATGKITGTASGSAYAGSGLLGATGCKASLLSFTLAGSDSSCIEGHLVGGYTPTRSIPDVAASFPGDDAISGSVVPNALLAGSGVYIGTSNGDLTLNTSELDPGKSIIIKASGTVTIAGNQTYNSDNKGAKYTSVSQLPQLVIIAKNINIADNVTQIDAWLIANDSTTPTNGRINTCSTVDIAAKLDSNTCSKPLTVNGPVMAQKLYLRRTAGSGTGVASGDPAEVFNLRPDAYMWATARATGNGRIQTVYTTELPPRL